MNAHTRGPWEICRRGQLYGVRHVADDGCPTDICRIDWFVSTGVDRRAEANATLICAAPDLLNALVTLANAAESLGIPVDAARAAISKATGGQ